MRSRNILVWSDGCASAGSALHLPSPPPEKGRHARGLVARSGHKNANRHVAQYVALYPSPHSRNLHRCGNFAAGHAEPPLPQGVCRTLTSREQSKFREDYLGGVTARVVKNTRIPVPLSF